MNWAILIAGAASVTVGIFGGMLLAELRKMNAAHTLLWVQYKDALHAISERAKKAESYVDLGSALEVQNKALSARDEEVRFLRGLVSERASTTAFVRGKAHTTPVVPETLESHGRWPVRDTSTFVGTLDLTDTREPLKS